MGLALLLAFVVLWILVAGALGGWHLFESRRPPRRGCWRCGYNLAGVPEGDARRKTCSECAARN